MNCDEYLGLIEDIPSDEESDIGDVDENEVDDEMIADQGVKDLFDIMNMPMDFDEVATNLVDDGQWDSEDEMPLSLIRSRELGKKTIWTTSTNYCIKNFKTFEEQMQNINENLDLPINFFLTIFPKELIDHIVFQTNLYAFQKKGNDTAFIHTNSDEIRKFLGLNLLMGIKKLPSYRDYWSSNFAIRDNFISSVLPRDRFVWLLGNIHLNDNILMPKRDQPNYDKLYKLRPLINKLSETFLSSLKPTKNQSIDESMIRFKGRSSLKQYMPLKPVKRGYKVWVRADESGYACQFQIYTGKSENTAEKDLGARVVIDLTRDLVGMGHHIYFDNYFNSVALMKKLQSEMLYATGTVRQGRKDLPNDLSNNKMKRGESDWRVSKDGLVYLKWMDRKPVHFLSNYADPTDIREANRKRKDGTSDKINCPLMVVDYNKNMGYVDKLDMLKSIYEIDRKSKKWWHRIFWYLLDISLVNSYVLFKKNSNFIDMGKNLNLKEFKLAVSLGLMGADANTPKRGRPFTPKHNLFKVNVPQEIRYDSCSHMPTHGTSRRCAFCSTTSEPHRTRWMCSR